MFCDLTEIENKSCKNLSLNDLRRNSFLVIQSNNYNNQANKNIRKVRDQSNVSTEFFSKKNIAVLQQLIKTELLKRTQNKFSLSVDQDETSLLLVMKNIYSEYGNLDSVTTQIKKLNYYVIEFIMPDIITGVKQYHGYIDKINKPLEPINRPINVNNKGRKQTRSTTTLFI